MPANEHCQAGMNFWVLGLGSLVAGSVGLMIQTIYVVENRFLCCPQTVRSYPKGLKARVTWPSHANLWTFLSSSSSRKCLLFIRSYGPCLQSHSHSQNMVEAIVIIITNWPISFNMISAFFSSFLDFLELLKKLFRYLQDSDFLHVLE